MAKIPDEIFSSELGQIAILNTKVVGAYDPATGMAESVITTKKVKIVAFPLGFKDIDGTLVQSGDQRVLISVVGIALPHLDDTITIGTVTYTITFVKPSYPAGIPVLCECNIRGA
jgi:hypothetical protein